MLPVNLFFPTKLMAWYIEPFSGGRGSYIGIERIKSHFPTLIEDYFKHYGKSLLEVKLCVCRHFQSNNSEFHQIESTFRNKDQRFLYRVRSMYLSIVINLFPIILKQESRIIRTLRNPNAQRRGIYL
jgi:hypothetical protein